MWRNFGSIGLILTLWAVPCTANTIGISVSGLPTTYMPGNTLTFGVELTGAMDLNSYNVGLTLTSDKGTAGTDFYFEGSPTTDRPPDSANTYVFAADLSVSPFGFVATADKELGTNTALLSLSDFLDSGQFVTDASPNTMLATVVIGTTSRTGDLTLRFDSSVLELLTPDWQPVPGSSTLAANLDSFDPPVVTQVPEPSSIALLCPLLGLCGIAIGWRKRMRNHVVQSSNFGEHRVSKPRRRRTSVPFRCRRFPSYLSKSIVEFNSNTSDRNCGMLLTPQDTVVTEFWYSC